MKPATLILRTLLAWFALILAQIIANVIVPISVPVARGALSWLLLTYFLTVAILAYIAQHADLRGWKLGFALAVIPAAIALTNFIEGAVFLKGGLLSWPRLAAQTLLTYLLVAPVWGVLFGRRPAGDSQVHPLAGRSSAEKLWRFVVSDVSYIVLYYTAGTIIFPYVRDFYATQTLPSMPTIVALCPFRRSVSPTAFGDEFIRSRQKRSLITTTGALPGLSTSGLSTLPRWA